MKARLPLLLASQSASRRQLLESAQIPFRLVAQSADERSCSWDINIEVLVQMIAALKMKHVVMPPGLDREQAQFVLTADTLTGDSSGQIYGKPASYEDAVATLRRLRSSELRTATAFRLEKRVWTGREWICELAHEEVVIGGCRFNIPDHWIDSYLAHSIALDCAGSMAVEGYGCRFVASMHGSYTAITGLPIFELQVALERLGFFEP